MLCVNVLRTWEPASSGAYAPCVRPVTLHHGLFTCCFAYDVWHWSIAKGVCGSSVLKQVGQKGGRSRFVAVESANAFLVDIRRDSAAERHQWTHQFTIRALYHVSGVCRQRRVLSHHSDICAARQNSDAANNCRSYTSPYEGVNPYLLPWQVRYAQSQWGNSW